MAGWVGRYVSQGVKLKKRTQTLASVVQEHYLRDDIPCGSALCSSSCRQETPRLPDSCSHYLIPDADAVAAYLEMLELPQITGVIYLSSVVREVYERGTQRTYSRLRALYTDARRHSSYFDDQHFLYTWLMLKDHLSVQQKEAFQKVPAGPSVIGGAGQASHRERDQKQSRSLPAVQVAAEWFADHLEQRVPIVILSDHVGTPPKHSPEEELDMLLDRFGSSVTLEPGEGSGTSLKVPPGVQVLTTAEYFSRYWTHDSIVVELYDSLVQAKEAAATEAGPPGEGATGGSHKGGPLYKEHLGVHAVDEGLQEGVIRFGVFHVSAHAPTEGFVRPSNKGETSRAEIFIPNRTLQNRALAGDLVAVRLLPRSRWRAPKQTRRPSQLQVARSEAPSGVVAVEEEDEMALESGPSGVEGDRQGLLGADETEMGAGPGGAEGEEGGAGEGVPTGEVVRVMQRVPRDYVACLRLEDEEELMRKGSSRQEALLCVPMDRRIPMIRLRTRHGLRLAGQRFVARIDGWERTSMVPHGHMVRVLGPIGDLDAECASLLVENGIMGAPFTSGALRELPVDMPERPWRIPAEELATRRDVRADHFTCSIDPPGSKDVDDALSVKRLPSGLIEVGVHIADVSYFVQQGSLLDLEARARGTTVYLVDRRLDMLPAVLSENLCSLLGGVDRLAVSVIWTVDPGDNFALVDTWFGRTIIHSRHQMAYEQAQMIFEGQDLPARWQILGGTAEVARIQSNLEVLVALTQVWRSQRQQDGALELASAELRFEVNDKKEPVSVQTKHEILMNGVVAELMIGANASVAKRVYEAIPSTALLRRHPPPRLDGFQHLIECCEARGFTLDTSSNKALAASLERMRSSSDPVVELAVKAMATRAMSEAEYFSTGQVADPNGFYHYGLALEFYTHFTSPIRRYADIVVHRLLMAALDLCVTPGAKLEPGPLDLADQAGTISPRSLPGVLPSLELQQVAEHINERHRASKAAQKECSQLYLLLYLAQHSQAERAVVTSVHSQGLMVFVPKYDLRGPVYLQDKHGRAVLPATSEEEEEGGRERSRATAGMVVQKQGKSIRIMRTAGGEVEAATLHQFSLLQSVWVELRADGSRAHAPTLRIRLLSDRHPAALAAASKQTANGCTAVGHTGGPRLPAGNLVGPAAGASRLAWQARAMAEARSQRGKEGPRSGLRLQQLDSSGGQGTGGDRRGEEGSATVHDEVERFRELATEACSLFLSTPALAGGSPPGLVSERPPGATSDQHVSAAAATGLDTAPGLPHVTRGDPEDVGGERGVAATLRKRWQDSLMQASLMKARRSRSFLAEGDSRQQKRGAMECRARERARRALARWIRLTNARARL